MIPLLQAFFFNFVVFFRLIAFSFKVKKYKKTSRATSALDTSVVLECVLIRNYQAYCIMFGSLYTFKPEHVKKGQMSSAFI